jgi:hypothetical protein
VRLCQWAEVVYGCDGPWWRARKGLPEYTGLKLAHDSSVCATFRDVHKIEITNDDKLRFDVPGLVGSGGNSGFQALNIASQFGARRILLIGFDMHVGSGLHWYGRNSWSGSNNPAMVHLMRWRDAFTLQAPVLRRMGIEVVNASADSALRCFDIAGVDETLQRWNL